MDQISWGNDSRTKSAISFIIQKEYTCDTILEHFLWKFLGGFWLTWKKENIDYIGGERMIRIFTRIKFLLKKKKHVSLTSCKCLMCVLLTRPLIVLE